MLEQDAKALGLGDKSKDPMIDRLIQLDDIRVIIEPIIGAVKFDFHDRASTFAY